MKKTGLLLFSMLLLFMLASCGFMKADKEEAAEENDSGEEEVVKAEIKDASYILSGKDDGESVEDKEGGLMQVELQIENLSSNSVTVYPEQHIHLYDGENQLDPSNDTYPLIGLEMDTNSDIGAEKQKDMNVIFEVEKDSEYEMSISPMSSDYEAVVKDTTLNLDTSEYNDSLKTLEEPGDALEAYIDTIYLDQDNDDYKELVSADKGDLQDDAEEHFGDMLKEFLTVDLSDGDIEKYYKSFKEAQADMSEFDINVVAHANGKALVELEYEALSYFDLSDKIGDYKTKYSDKHDDFDTEKEEEYALSKFDKIVDDLDTEKGTSGIELLLEEDDDGHWTIDDSHSSTSERIRDVFAEGVI